MFLKFSAEIAQAQAVFIFHTFSWNFIVLLPGKSKLMITSRAEKDHRRGNAAGRVDALAYHRQEEYCLLNDSITPSAQ